jgi:hypothetical protein
MRSVGFLYPSADAALTGDRAGSTRGKGTYVFAPRQSLGILRRMAVTAGIVCHKDGFGCTIVDSNDGAEDHDIDVPPNLTSRGEKLAWLADEARRLIQSAGAQEVRVQKPGGGKFGGASSERHEVEAAVQIGVHHVGVACDMLNREQVRAALGVPKGKGAYEQLLQRVDVKARSNAERRDQYLLALAARR